ncbi:DUF3007-containing protein [Aureococcus anophagefferens]|nr:DUF3007-containing protein [Aureococcus anophagefferens]
MAGRPMSSALGVALAVFAALRPSAAFQVPARRAAALPLRRTNALARPVPAGDRRNRVALRAEPGGQVEENKLPWYFDPGTYGGVIVLTVLALVVPYALWAGLVATGMDSNEVGAVLSGVFVIGSILLWTFSYIFRVFTKNMTYSTQLKQYEDAVIAKRFEELQDEVGAPSGDRARGTLTGRRARRGRR